MKITRLGMAISTTAVAVLAKLTQRRNDSVKKLLVLTLGMIAMAASSQASIIISLTNVTASGVNWSWNYTVLLSGDQNFRNSSTIPPDGGGISDVAMIFDFGGFVSLGWTANELTNAGLSTPTVGPLVPPLTNDDSSLVNIVLRNNGPTMFGGGILHTLGVLNVVSTQSATTAFNGNYSSQAQKTSDLTTTLNQGLLPVPLAPTEPSGVPEPATFVLIGGALVGLGFMRLRRA